MSKNALFNKFDLLHKVLNSNLSVANKPLLISLILLADDDSGVAWPSVERLCRARGIQHEKNFRGVENYLPGLVTVTRRGRGGNHYRLNIAAIESLTPQDVHLKHTVWPIPAVAPNDPAPADTVPAHAAELPSHEGANSTRHNTRNSREDSTETSFKEDDIYRCVNDEPPAAAVLHVASPLDLELPVPGDIRGLDTQVGTQPLEANESAEDIPAGRRSPEPQEVATTASSGHYGREQLMRRIAKWVSDEAERPQVLEKALELQAAGFVGRGDDVVLAASDALCEW